MRYFPTKRGAKEPQNPQNHRVVKTHPSSSPKQTSLNPSAGTSLPSSTGEDDDPEIWTVFLGDVNSAVDILEDPNKKDPFKRNNNNDLASRIPTSGGSTHFNETLFGICLSS